MIFFNKASLWGQIILTSLFILLVSVLFGDESTEMRVTGDINVSPVIYGPAYRMNGVKADTAWMLGVQNKDYTQGLELTFNAFFNRSQDQAYNLEGYWFNAAALWDQYFQVDDFMELKWGWGGVWKKNNFFYNVPDSGGADSGADNWGLSFVINSRFFLPVKFLNFEILNKIDLLFAFNPDFSLKSMAPYYTGGIRINFMPGLSWINLYVEMKGIYWSYTQSSLELDTGLWELGTGISLDTSFTVAEKAALPKPLIKINPLRELPAESKLRSAPHAFKSAPGVLPAETTETETDRALKALAEAKPGTEIGFKLILFKEDSAVLLEESLSILNRVAGVLKAQPETTVNIATYVPFLGDPDREYQLYTLRIRAIKQQLMENGITESRLYTSATVRIFADDPDERAKTLFRIIHKGL